MVLRWRNDNNVRKWMHNSDIILEEDHFNFLKKLKNDDSKLFFLLSKDNNYIGVIYFSKIDFKKKKAEFGLYSNPDIKGVGSVLQEIVCEYAITCLKLTTLTAEVLEKNISALKLYKKFKFKELSNTTINNKNIILLELSLS